MQKQHKPSMHTLLMIVVLMIAGALASQPIAQAIQTQENVVRRPVVFSRPLSEQLRPGDKVVEFFLDVGDERVVPSTPLSQSESLATAVADSEQVLLFEVESSEGRLIYEGWWITTLLSGKVVEVIKAARSSNTRSGSHLSFLVGGGELQINGVTVRTGTGNPYESHRIYVVFLRDQPIPSQGLTSEIATAYPLLVDGDRVKAVADRSKELDGLAMADIRRLAAKYR